MAANPTAAPAATLPAPLSKVETSATELGCEAPGVDSPATEECGAPGVVVTAPVVSPGGLPGPGVGCSPGAVVSGAGAPGVGLVTMVVGMVQGPVTVKVVASVTVMVLLLTTT